MAVTQTRALLSIVLVVLAMIAGPVRNCDVNLASPDVIAAETSIPDHCDGCAGSGQTISEICAFACANTALVTSSVNLVPFDGPRAMVAARNIAGLVGMPARPDPHPPRSLGIG